MRPNASQLSMRDPALAAVMVYDPYAAYMRALMYNPYYRDPGY